MNGKEATRLVKYEMGAGGGGETTHVGETSAINTNGP